VAKKLLNHISDNNKQPYKGGQDEECSQGKREEERGHYYGKNWI
jgi:hypothetical protein